MNFQNERNTQLWDPRLHKVETQYFKQEQFSQNDAIYKLDDFYEKNKILEHKVNSWVWSDTHNSLYILKNCKKDEQAKPIMHKSFIQLQDTLEGICFTSVPDQENNNFLTIVDTIILIPKNIVGDLGLIERFYSQKLEYFSILSTNFEVTYF